jgi:hypothetical protein
VSITTIGVEMVVVPNIDVIKKGVLIGSITKLGSGIRWSLDRKEFESKFGTTNNHY